MKKIKNKFKKSGDLIRETLSDDMIVVNANTGGLYLKRFGNDGEYRTIGWFPTMEGAKGYAQLEIAKEELRKKDEKKRK